MDKNRPVCYCTQPWNCTCRNGLYCGMYGGRCDEICIAAMRRNQDEEKQE